MRVRVRVRVRVRARVSACLLPAAYWSLVLVSVFEMTSLVMSISFMSSFEIW